MRQLLRSRATAGCAGPMRLLVDSQGANVERLCLRELALRLYSISQTVELLSTRRDRSGPSAFSTIANSQLVQGLRLVICLLRQTPARLLSSVQGLYCPVRKPSQRSTLAGILVQHQYPFLHPGRSPLLRNSGLLSCQVQFHGLWSMPPLFGYRPIHIPLG